MRRSTFVIGSALLIFALFALGAWHADAETNVTSADKIEGTWLITIFPGPGPVPPFQLLQSFGTGNTVTQTSALFHAHTATGLLAPVFPFNFSDVHGTWKKEGGNNFTITLLQLVFDPGTREHVGFARVRGTIVVEGDTLTGESFFESIMGPPGLPDPDTGTVVFTGGLTTFVGRRIR